MRVLLFAPAILSPFTSPGIIDMSIGILALVFGFGCGAVALIGSTAPEEDRPRQSVDYTGIYKTIQVKEI